MDSIFTIFSHPLTRARDVWDHNFVAYIHALFAVCSLPRNILSYENRNYTVWSGLGSRENFGLICVVL